MHLFLFHSLGSMLSTTRCLVRSAFIQIRLKALAASEGKIRRKAAVHSLSWALLFRMICRGTCALMHLSLWQSLHWHSSLFCGLVSSVACSGSASTFNSLTSEVSVFSQTIKCSRRSLHPPTLSFPSTHSRTVWSCCMSCPLSQLPSTRRVSKEKNRNGSSLYSNALILDVLEMAYSNNVLFERYNYNTYTSIKLISTNLLV